MNFFNFKFQVFLFKPHEPTFGEFDITLSYVHTRLLFQNFGKAETRAVRGRFRLPSHGADMFQPSCSWAAPPLGDGTSTSIRSGHQNYMQLYEHAAKLLGHAVAHWAAFQSLPWDQLWSVRLALSMSRHAARISCSQQTEWSMPRPGSPHSEGASETLSIKASSFSLFTTGFKYGQRRKYVNVTKW